VGRKNSWKISFTNDTRIALRRILGLEGESPPRNPIVLLIDLYPRYAYLKEQGGVERVPEYAQIKAGLQRAPDKIERAYTYAKFEGHLEAMCPSSEDLKVLLAILAQYPYGRYTVREKIKRFLSSTPRGARRTKAQEE